MSEEITEQKEAPASFSARLIAAMSDMENPTKSKTANVPTKSGKSYQYKYETLDQVLAVIRPALASYGLALTQQQAWSDNTSSYVLRTVVFDADEERLMDERPLHDYADAQAAGSWETYMRRYALRTAFGLAGEDDDGAATVGASRSAAQPRKSQNRPSAQQSAKPASDGNGDGEKKRELWHQIGELKKRAIELGIKEEGITSWIASTYKNKDMKEFNLTEVLGVKGYLSTLIMDKESLQPEQDGENNG